MFQLTPALFPCMHALLRTDRRSRPHPSVHMTGLIFQRAAPQIIGIVSVPAQRPKRLAHVRRQRRARAQQAATGPTDQQPVGGGGAASRVELWR